LASAKKAVMPATAGIQKGLKNMDSRLRENDDRWPDDKKMGF